jgi:hypothetical protein
VIDELSLIAVVKVFKPTLKRQVSVMAVNKLLQQHHIDATVSSKGDSTYGFICASQPRSRCFTSTTSQNRVRPIGDSLAMG